MVRIFQNVLNWLDCCGDRRGGNVDPTVRAGWSSEAGEITVALPGGVDGLATSSLILAGSLIAAKDQA